jgi:hypothetical protein
VPKRLRACPHSLIRSDGSKVPHRQVEADRLLGQAEKLVDAAAGDLARAEEREIVRAEIERLEILLETAGLTVDEGLRVAQDEALDRAVDLEDAPGPDSVLATLDEADDAAGAAVGIATRIRRRSIADPLLERGARIRRRIAMLRARLDDL